MTETIQHPQLTKAGESKRQSQFKQVHWTSAPVWAALAYLSESVFSTKLLHNLGQAASLSQSPTKAATSLGDASLSALVLLFPGFSNTMNTTAVSSNHSLSPHTSHGHTQLWGGLAAACLSSHSISCHISSCLPGSGLIFLG